MKTTTTASTLYVSPEYPMEAAPAWARKTARRLGAERIVMRCAAHHQEGRWMQRSINNCRTDQHTEEYKAAYVADGKGRRITDIETGYESENDWHFRNLGEKVEDAVKRAGKRASWVVTYDSSGASGRYWHKTLTFYRLS